MPPILDRITLLVSAFGAAIAALCFAIGGIDTGLGAAAGALVAVVNLIALRVLVGRLLMGQRQKRATRAVASALLASKLAVLGLVVWVLLVEVGVDAVGFALGLGALVVGATAAAGPLLGGLSGERFDDGAKDVR